jgi:hypothetical protein
MKKVPHRWLVLLMTPLGLAIAVGSLFPIRSAVCGESSLYRIAWGLYACEYNDEAGVDFYCNARIGGWREYLRLRDLTGAECRQRQELYYVPLLYRIGLLR